MIIDFLKKYQEELISRKIDIKESNDLLETKLMEEIKFLDVLNANDETYFSDFTPHVLNEKNKEKAIEIQLNIDNLNSQLEVNNNELKSLDSRLQEVNNYLTDVSLRNYLSEDNSDSLSKDYIVSELSKIKDFLLLDPYRASIEIDNLINSLN